MLTLCCRPDMGAALKPQEGESCDDATVAITPPTMADVIRERKKKSGGAGFATLRRLLPRRPNAGGDKGCEHGRFIRSVVGSWAPQDVALLAAQLEAAALLRDLATQAELAREPAPAAAAALQRACCDIELVGNGWTVPACRVLLAVRSTYFARLLHRYPDSFRIPLEGAVGALTRTQMLLCIHKLYSHSTEEWDRIRSSEEFLDIDSVNSLCTCGESSSVDAATLNRICEALLGASTRPFTADLKRLLHTGEMSDCKLAFVSEDGGVACELPAHRAVLAARSRLLRSTLSRRSPNSKQSSIICIDEKVFNRRFAKALLHAAYTDQVDLSLIGRPQTSSTSNLNTSNTMSWGRGSKPSTATMLEDAFQLYEIAKFLEMPIAVQGCEDAIVEALSAATLPAVLAWAAQPASSAWVQRQALRYLRDEYTTIMSSSHAWGVPRSALQHALASPYLQASESAALRGVLRWGGARGKRGGAHVADLCALVRAPLLPDHCEHKAQAIRRGLIPAPTESASVGWLTCPPRAFIPYLDALKALLDGGRAPAQGAALGAARARRARGLPAAPAAPDTLYMVTSSGAAERECVDARTLRALRARVRTLSAARTAQRALAHPASSARAVYTQLALRAVRERALPDACAELLLADVDFNTLERERRTSSVPPERGRGSPSDDLALLCRGGGSQRGAAGLLAGSSDSSLSGTCRREGSSRNLDLTLHRSAARLSARVPDVALTPNANTHLLTHASYLQYSGILQLDLGDGAMHTVRPGSRAQRASTSAQSRPQRERAHTACSTQGSASDDNNLRHSIDMTYMRGVSALGGRLATLPHPHQQLSRASSAESGASSSRLSHYRSSSLAEQHL